MNVSDKRVDSAEAVLRRCSLIKISTLKNFANFTGKHLLWSIIFIGILWKTFSEKVRKINKETPTVMSLVDKVTGPGLQV